jgi:hypothetical protein
MTRRYTIFFLVFVAYTILQAHNVTPHFHELCSVQPHTHHHDHGADHDHDHDNEKDPEDNIFGHFEHVGFTELQYSNTPKPERSPQQHANDFDAVVQDFNIIIDLWRPPLNIRPPLLADVPIPLQAIAYFFPLKAPPSVFPV